jgi:lipoprotein signal peptidase
MTEKSYRWVFWSLMIIGLVSDQVSKYVVFHQLFRQDHHHIVIIPGVFTLSASYEDPAEARREDGSWRVPLQSIDGEPPPYVNRGALFGWFHSQGWGNAFFSIVSVLAAVGIIFWSTRPAMAHNLLHCAALGLILGGTLGNLYDRIIFLGVRDFLDVFIGDYHWPTFNIADCCLVIGACLLLLQAFFNKVPGEQPAAVAATAEAKSA